MAAPAFRQAMPPLINGYNGYMMAVEKIGKPFVSATVFTKAMHQSYHRHRIVCLPVAPLQSKPIRCCPLQPFHTCNLA